MIYIIGTDCVLGRHYQNVCKIGVSNNPCKRLTTLQVGNPFELEIYLTAFSMSQFTMEFDREMEVDLHRMFSEKHMYGEWYNLINEDFSDIYWHLQECGCDVEIVNPFIKDVFDNTLEIRADYIDVNDI